MLKGLVVFIERHNRFIFIAGILLFVLVMVAHSLTSEPNCPEVEPGVYHCQVCEQYAEKQERCWTEVFYEHELPEPTGSPFWLFIREYQWVFLGFGIVACLSPLLTAPFEKWILPLYKENKLG
jgi:hypothetical protein